MGKRGRKKKKVEEVKEPEIVEKVEVDYTIIDDKAVSYEKEILHNNFVVYKEGTEYMETNDFDFNSLIIVDSPSSTMSTSELMQYITDEKDKKDLTTNNIYTLFCSDILRRNNYIRAMVRLGKEKHINIIPLCTTILPTEVADANIRLNSLINYFNMLKTGFPKLHIMLMYTDQAKRKKEFGEVHTMRWLSNVLEHCPDLTRGNIILHFDNSCKLDIDKIASMYKQPLMKIHLYKDDENIKNKLEKYGFSLTNR